MFDKGSKTAGIGTKVATPSSKSSIGKGPSQPLVGKLKGMTSMGNGATMGQGVKTTASNPIQGQTRSDGSAMGNGGVIKAFV